MDIVREVFARFRLMGCKAVDGTGPDLSGDRVSHTVLPAEGD